jgi:hypothetical protein
MENPHIYKRGAKVLNMHRIADDYYELTIDDLYTDKTLKVIATGSKRAMINRAMKIYPHGIGTIDDSPKARRWNGDKDYRAFNMARAVGLGVLLTPIMWIILQWKKALNSTKSHNNF